jgi:hypothetical protein
MHVLQFVHKPGSGWSQTLPTDLDGPRTLVLAFGARALLGAPSALQELATAFPHSVLMGCSSAGEIAHRQVDDATISVAVARFEHTDLKRATTPLLNAADSAEAGRRLAAQLPAAGLRAVFLLSAGVDVNGSDLLRGLAAALPAGVAVSGGMAGDGSAFERTWVLDEGQARERCVTAVGLYGQALRIGHGCSGGWTEFGPERHITRAEGNVLYELDGQPALGLYKHYLGNLVGQLPGSALLFPLSLRSTSGAAPVVRTILGIDEAQQSMTFAGDMPTGAATHLMRTSVDRLVASAEDAANQALHDVESHGPVLALSVSCIGRRLVMGERTEEEVEAVVDQLPAGSVHAGFYSYGEFAPSQGCSTTDLHNQTMTLTVFSEAAAA